MAVTPQTDKRLWRLKKGDERPLYRQIESLILELVEAGHLAPGSALPSYLWLSKTLEVADKTVRQAYADLAQAGVLTVRKGRGTFVAKTRTRARAAGAVPSGGAGVLGLVAPPLPVEPAHAEVFWRLVRAIQEAAYREHLDTLLLPRGGDLNAPGIAERLADPARVDGLILLHDPGASFLQRLSALGVPVLLADVPAEDAQAKSPARVVFDHRGAARALTYKLIGAGHRRISLVAPARDARAREWELGWRHAMGAAGLPVEPG
ncbi:MAG: GntR family transcriptional regulator, partial [Planctomycetes bacterium]|nr:GntR family transcriptional regulator [Planctomycetota bacterium]